MSLTAVMEAIAELEAGIELPGASELEQATIKKAYTVPPLRNQALVSLPCFINWPDAIPDDLRMGNFVETNLTVQVDFFGPNTDQGARYAYEYFDATLAAFRAQQPAGQRLGGAVDYLTVRTERPMVATLEWAGQGYPGFRLYLDLILFETVVPA